MVLVRFELAATSVAKARRVLLSSRGSEDKCRVWFKPDSRDFGTFNYVIYRVIKVRYESPAYPLANARTLNEIRREMNEKWARQSGTSKVLSVNYF
jgi:hypothetical protein